MENKKPKTKGKTKLSRPKPLSRKPGYSKSKRYYGKGGTLE